MKTQTAQIRVTLPIQLQAYLRTKADKFGLGLSTYIRNLIINDVKDVEYPVYQMSEKAINDYKEAKRAEKNDSLVEVGDVVDFLNDL